MCLLLLFVSLLTLSCRREQLPGPTPGISTPAGAPAATATYLALGDSYTIGEGAANSDRWPVQLAELARQQNVGLMGPDLITRTGWTTAELADAITSAHLAKTYEVVLLLIGVNNQYRGPTVGRYRTELQQLLHTALGLAGGRGGRAFVFSIPDWGQSPFAAGQGRARIGAESDQFNAAARQECQALGIAFVDITPSTRAAAGDHTQFTRDGLHYSGSQMQRWAQLALPVVQAALKTP